LKKNLSSIKPIQRCTNLLFVLLIITFRVSAKPVDTLKLKQDTSKNLNEIIIKGYYNAQPILRSVAAVALLDSNQFKNQQNISLVSAFNTVAGVRMEERSPGSYRLSLRGSLLRSPFGIRNIKIYMNDIPLTDAGGNTYLNAIDPHAINNVEIYKGPEANIFGANTGGAMLINNVEPTQNQISASVTAGSYGLFHQTAKIFKQFKNYSFSFMEGYQSSNGYRQNSNMTRKYFQTAHRWDYNTNGSLKLFAFYSDLNYQTPGGLTLAQQEENPKLARPATATLPGAITQQAGIYNKTSLIGLTNSYYFNSSFKHVITLFTSYTDFKNPFITNYEKRYESTLGLRSFIEYVLPKENFNLKTQIGLESSRTKTQINNFDNNAGIASLMQASDRLKANQDFAFGRVNIDFKQKILIELSSSFNFFNYKYESYFPNIIGQQQRNFKIQVMPKLATSYLINQNLSIRVTVSKGYSPPTIAEVRASDNNINNNLQAELGWNYETGLRFKTQNNRFYANANLFQFQLKNAIVRRLNTNDVEYFINAGGTQQKGIELESNYWLIKNHATLITGLKLASNYTYNHFRFANFVNTNIDYSGNKLTGVPTNVWASNILLELNSRFYLFVQHNYTSAIPLNDANTANAKRYNLIELKTGLNNIKINKTNFEIFAGINNLSNEKYSLGNDLNAVGNRFYNPATNTNFYIGAQIKL
jgi:iron complex outermembrane receptor protein